MEINANENGTENGRRRFTYRLQIANNTAINNVYALNSGGILKAQTDFKICVFTMQNLQIAMQYTTIATDKNGHITQWCEAVHN